MMSELLPWVFVAAALVVGGVVLLALMGTGQFTIGHSDAQGRAALRLLKQEGVLSLYTSIGDPEPTIRAVESKVARLREWVKTLPDASERSAYNYWLSVAERNCDESREARMREEAVSAATQRMTRPLSTQARLSEPQP